MQKMSARELEVRVTNALVQKDWTFQQEKVEEIQLQKQQQRTQEQHANFLARAREHWSSSGA